MSTERLINKTSAEGNLRRRNYLLKPNKCCEQDANEFWPRNDYSDRWKGRRHEFRGKILD